jgi:hypothetical protein
LHRSINNRRRIECRQAAPEGYATACRIMHGALQYFRLQANDSCWKVLYRNKTAFGNIDTLGAGMF